MNVKSRCVLVAVTSTLPLMRNELYAMQCDSLTNSGGVHVVMFHLLEFLSFKYYAREGKSPTCKQIRIGHQTSFLPLLLPEEY